jgi:cobalt/nickel transport system permease protein
MIAKESLKLINSFCYSFVIAFFPLQYIFLLPLIVVMIKKDHILEVLKKLILLNFFIVVLVVFVALHNINQAIELLVRTNLILFFNLTLFHSSKGYDIIRGLDALHFPPKVVSVFYFTLSLINYLLIDFKDTKNTLKARGFINTTSMFTYQTYGNIFAMIFIKALKKSDDMKYSMTARGFEDKIFFLNSNQTALFEKILFISILIALLKGVYELLG